jgi:8-oxo-dGTP diphosphatase
MKLATLCYLKRDGRTLMLHRTKKANDVHEDKWTGLGGKLEPGETPEDCVSREVREECGLEIRQPVLRGFLTFPAFAHGEDWYVFVFVARDFTGTLIPSAEGDLGWIPDERLLALELWEGDRHFLKVLESGRFFSAMFRYVDRRLVDYRVVTY